MNSPTPNGWIESTLDRHCTKITDGSHLSPVKMDGGWPIATVENMRSRHIDVPSCRRIPKFDFDSLIKNSCSPEIGDVLFSKDGTIGKTFVFKQKEEIVLLSSIAIIRTEKSQLVPDFLTQYLKSPFFFRSIENATSGSAIKRVVLKDIKSLPLKLPPLPEQQKIASILTAVDDVIESTQAQINKLKDLKTGMMQELLIKGIGHTEFKDSPVGRIPKAWDTVKIENIASYITSGSCGWAEYYSESGAIFIRIGNLTREHINFRFNDIVYVNPPEGGEGKRTLVQVGDVLISITADLGIIGVVNANVGEAYVNQHVSLVRLNDPQLSRWVGHYLSHEESQKQFTANNDSGAKAGLNLSAIKNLEIAIPPSVERTKIVQTLDAIDNDIVVRRLKLSRSKDIKKALMQDLLTGKVRVKVASQ